MALGLAVSAAVDLAIGGVVVLVALLAFARSSHQTERLAGLYWIAFTVYSVVFFGITIRFGFYPFYAAFLISVLVALTRGGLRVDTVSGLLYLGFMTTVAWSFVTFADPVGSDVIQRVLAYVVGAMVFLQVRSREGLVPVATAVILASVAVAGFVIYSSIESGFGYRGGVAANPNTVSRIIGYGALVAFGSLLEWRPVPRAASHKLALVLALGIMAYGATLLASRGMAIGLALSMSVMWVRGVTLDWRSVRVLAIAVALASLALALPGGQGLIQRFTASDENLESAGSRIPLWEVTLESLAAGNVAQLVFGHGFDSSKPVVERFFLGQTSVHNSYLHFLYEFGVISLALHVALLAYLVGRAWFVPNHHGIVMLGLTCFLAIESLSGDVTSTFDYWVLLGYAAAIGLWARPGGSSAVLHTGDRT